MLLLIVCVIFFLLFLFVCLFVLYQNVIMCHCTALSAVLMGFLLCNEERLCTHNVQSRTGTYFCAKWLKLKGIIFRMQCHCWWTLREAGKMSEAGSRQQNSSLLGIQYWDMGGGGAHLFGSRGLH